MSYRADKLVIDGHTGTHTRAGNDNTPRPKLASGKKTDGFESGWRHLAVLDVLCMDNIPKILASYRPSMYRSKDT